MALWCLNKGVILSFWKFKAEIGTKSDVLLNEILR